MKKILLVIVGLLFITGCGTKEVSKNYDAENQAMKDTLIKYGTLVYDKYIKGEETLEPRTYSMTLTELKEHAMQDISMFINPETGVACNPDNTKIEIIVATPIEEGKPNYTFNAVLSCE